MPAFSDRYIKGLKPKSKPYYVREGVGSVSAGFAIRIRPSGVKTWYYIYKSDGKQVELSLGQYPAMGLADAREAYREKRELRDQGIDPGLSIRQKSPSGSFGELGDAYVEWLRLQGKESAAKYERDLRTAVYPIIRRTRVARDVTTDEIKAVLYEKIQGGAETYANRLRQMLHAMFRFGIQYDNDPRYIDRPVRFGLALNPVSNIPINQAAERVGQRVLSADELRFHWENFTGAYGYLHRLMILLGGQRPIDILTTQWPDYDLDAGILDPARASKKNEVVNVLPLSEWTCDVLRALRMWSGGEGYLFPRGAGGRSSGSDSSPYMSLSGNSRAVKRFVDENELHPYCTKDLRRTMKTLMGRAGIAKETRDRLQNHNLGDVSSKHYDRFDYLPEKKEALSRWELYLMNEVKIQR